MAVEISNGERKKMCLRKEACVNRCEEDGIVLCVLPCDVECVPNEMNKMDVAKLIIESRAHLEAP